MWHVFVAFVLPMLPSAGKDVVLRKKNIKINLAHTSWQLHYVQSFKIKKTANLEANKAKQRQRRKTIIMHHEPSASRYDLRSVGQSVLVSSPSCCLTFALLLMSGNPSYGRSGLSFVLVTSTASVQFSKFTAGPRQLFILTWPPTCIMNREKLLMM
jgi:hypothetical protein